ncbi:MAG: translation initiation factor IF-3 [Candidatus Omnitrophica bacterium]|nr:translation initiation factor IF-3 [Candidatus Omnitrophota bacterium]
MNRQIWAKEIRLIDAKGTQRGILPLEEGLKLAQEEELDLVEIAPNAKPPVCRVIDFSKFKYEQNKRKKEAQKKHKKGDLKEIRVRPYISEHDYNTKLQQASKFLQERHKVKIRLFFKGREIKFLDNGRKVIERFVEALKDKGKVEVSPFKERRNIVVVIAPM